MRKKNDSKARRYYRLAAAACLILLARAAVAQQRTVNGYVRNRAGLPLPSASVYIVDTGGIILRYTFTNPEGAFHLILPQEEPPPLWLKVTYVGYKSLQVTLDPNQSSYSLALTKDTGMLREVVVRTAPPIEQSGDTTRYNVERFSQAEDRSIGDVLKRMPGIEVTADGSIYFNGEKISNLYIGGDDLTNGRYGIATRSIRKEMIANVDVVRDFQPVKVLKGKIHSGQTAINLTLKDPRSLKLSVNAMAGGGFPSLYDASVTGILLNDRFKAIDHIALNNSGVNYANNFQQLGTSNFISSINPDPSKFDLSLATIGPPDLPLPNYYFNQSGVVNVNNLYKTRNQVEFKVNAQVFRDRNNLRYSSRTDNYLSGDTIAYREGQALTNRRKIWNTSLNVMINKDRYFFYNNLNIGIARDNNASFMDFNHYPFEQKVNKQIQNFSNDLNWIPALPGKGIGELRWLISYYDNEQALDVGKGYYFPIPDQQGRYDDVIQGLNIPTLFSNFYLGYKIPGGIVIQEYRAGVRIKSEAFNSGLGLIRDGAEDPYSGDAGNHLQWRQHDVYVSAKYQIRHGRLKSAVTLPLAYQAIHYYQQEYGLDQRNGYLVFNPSLDISYDFDPEHFLDVRYTFHNDLSDMPTLFRGGVLKNYRLFTANEAGIRQKAVHSLAATYRFQRAVNMLFFNTGIRYDKTKAAALLSTELTDDIQQTIYLPYPNKPSSLSLHAGVSKYLFSLKATVSFKSRWSRYRYTAMINNEVQPAHSQALLFTGKIIKKILSGTELVYEPAGVWSSARMGAEGDGDRASLRHAFRLDQPLSLKITPLKNVKIDLTARHSLSKQSGEDAVQYFFSDAKVTYTYPPRRIDLSLSITNLFNVTAYTRYALSPYQLTRDAYQIRGRMGMIRFNYYF